MNNTVKNILVFSLGAAVGGVSTYYAVKERIKATYEQILEEEIDSMRDYMRKKKERIIEEVDNMQEPLNKVVDNEITATTLNGKTDKRGKKEERTEKAGKRARIARIDYNKIVKSSGYSVNENEAEGDENSKEEDLAEKYEKISNNGNYRAGDEPYVITLEQFNEEMDHYSKISISYYEDDDVLADETEQVIPDVFEIIGDDALDSFGEGSDDPEVVYVRNDKLHTDYEVIRLSKSYSKTVLGFEDEQ